MGSPESMLLARGRSLQLRYTGGNSPPFMLNFSKYNVGRDIGPALFQYLGRCASKIIWLPTWSTKEVILLGCTWLHGGIPFHTRVSGQVPATPGATFLQSRVPHWIGLKRAIKDYNTTRSKIWRTSGLGEGNTHIVHRFKGFKGSLFISTKRRLALLIVE